MIEETQIVILAAGKGTRMKSDLPKALVPLLGKPMITYLIDQLETLSLINKPIVIVGHKQELVREALGDRVDYVEQEQQLGTGHAVAQAQELCNKRNAKQVVVLNGDHPFTSADTVQSLVDRQKNHTGPLSMATVKVDDEAMFELLFSSFGRVVRGSDNLVTTTVEAKDATDQQLAIHEVNPNCLCFDAAWLWKELPTVSNDNAQQEYYITTLIEDASVAEGGIAAVIMRDFYGGIGVNNPEQLAMAEKFYQENHK